MNLIVRFFSNIPFLSVVQVVYFGDSMKSDVYPPQKFMQWDTVAVLEELEAEEMASEENLNVS